MKLSRINRRTALIFAIGLILLSVLSLSLIHISEPTRPY